MTFSDILNEYIEVPVNNDTTIEASIEYDEAIVGFLRATFEALKCDTIVGRYKILTESMVDMTTTIIRWFRNWLKEFHNRMRTQFNLFKHRLNEFRTRIVSISKKEIPDLPRPIEIKGYKFTIPNETLDTGAISSIMLETEKAVDAVMSNKASSRSVVNSICNFIGSNEMLSRYRGKTMNKLFVSPEKYGDTLFKYFRNESSAKTTFYVTGDMIRSFRDTVDKFEQIGLACERDKNNLENMVQNIIRYVNTQPVILADCKSIATAKALQQEYKERGMDYINGDLVDRDEVYKAIATIFARTNSTLKSVQLIYDKFLDAKIAAINDAISFYNSCIDAAIRMKPSEESVVSNYLDMVDESFDAAEDHMTNIKLTLCIEELYTLGDAWSKGRIVYEEPSVQVGVNKTPITKRRTNGVFSSLKEFIRKILEYIGNILSKFNTTLGDMMKSEVKWVADNAHYLQKIPPAVLKTMTLNYPNYIHAGAIQRIASPSIPMNGTLKTIAMDIGRQAGMSKIYNNPRYNAAQDCYRRYFPILAKMNPTDWKEAATRYYRGGANANPPQPGQPGQGETVTAQGADCQQVVIEMLQYCLNYKQYADSAIRTLDNIRKAISEQERTLGQLENERAQIRGQMQQPQATMNSYIPVIYSMLEDDVLENTEFHNMVFDIHGIPLYEDVGDAAVIAQNAAGRMGAANNRPAGPPHPQPGVQQQPPQMNFRNPQQQPQQPNPAQQRAEGINDLKQHISRALIEAYRVCVAIGAAKLTVCEEIFKAHMKILHQVVDAIRQYNGDTEQDQANRRYNQQQIVDQHNEHVSKMRKYEYMKRQRKARRSGLLGAMKNIIGG